MVWVLRVWGGKAGEMAVFFMQKIERESRVSCLCFYLFSIIQFILCFIIYVSILNVIMGKITR